MHESAGQLVLKVEKAASTGGLLPESEAENLNLVL
jgi:hypothetical protein